jgi:hypothetical protein
LKKCVYIYLILTYVMFKLFSYPVGTGALFPWVKQPGYVAYQALPSSGEVKNDENDGAIPLPPDMPSLHGA